MRKLRLADRGAVQYVPVGSYDDASDSAAAIAKKKEGKKPSYKILFRPLKYAIFLTAMAFNLLRVRMGLTEDPAYARASCVINSLGALIHVYLWLSIVTMTGGTVLMARQLGEAGMIPNFWRYKVIFCTCVAVASTLLILPVWGILTPLIGTVHWDVGCFGNPRYYGEDTSPFHTPA